MQLQDASHALVVHAVIPLLCFGSEDHCMQQQVASGALVFHVVFPSLYLCREDSTPWALMCEDAGPQKVDF